MGRTYVKVNSDFDATGTMMPRSIIWKDGRRFTIDAVQDFYPAGSGPRTDRYTVVIKGETKYLFFERLADSTRVGRWFVNHPTQG